MNINDGGPAFPYDHTFESVNERKGYADWHGTEGTGMSLRDYFATRAMSLIQWTPMEYQVRKYAAERCYEIADAMLAARVATGEPQA